MIENDVLASHLYYDATLSGVSTTGELHIHSYFLYYNKGVLNDTPPSKLTPVPKTMAGHGKENVENLFTQNKFYFVRPLFLPLAGVWDGWFLLLRPTFLGRPKTLFLTAKDSTGVASVSLSFLPAFGVVFVTLFLEMAAFLGNFWLPWRMLRGLTGGLYNVVFGGRLAEPALWPESCSKCCLNILVVKSLRSRADLCSRVLLE